MKKLNPALVLGVLLLAGTLTIGLLSVRLLDGADEVHYTIEEETGNPSMARGLVVGSHSTCRRQLYWDSTITLEDPGTAETVYRFDPREKPEPSWPDMLNIYVDFSQSPAVAREMQRLQDSLGDRAYETASKEIRLGDYVETYPLYFSGSLPYHTPDLDQVLQEYFQILVPEDQTITLDVHIDTHGTGYQNFGSAQEVPAYVPDCRSISLGDDLLFTINGRASDGTVLDFSRLPEGYGLFRLRKDLEVDMVHALDPAADLLQLTKSTDGSQILLLTAEKKRYNLLVLDTNSFELLQNLPIAPQNEPIVPQLQVLDNGLVLGLWEPTRIGLLSRQESGLYKVEFVHNLDLWGPYGSPGLDGAATAWDGKRLAVARPRYYDFGAAAYDTEFSVYVLNAQGLQYEAFVTNDLDNGPGYPNGADPFLTLSWK